jgi:ring-1,2-phenylacetyl-CoA epoxidase subunit PaaD
VNPISPALVWSALETVHDPELPVVNVVEMGIVRAVEVGDNGIRVTLTPTFSACPAFERIRQDILEVLHHLHPNIDLYKQIYPPWSSDWITATARDKLREFGIAPPTPGDSSLISLEPRVITCPKCGSLSVSRKNAFGSALCKMIYQCNSCYEPFEAMKTIT